MRKVSFKNFVPLLIILAGFGIYAYLESPEQVLNRANSGDGRAQLKLARRYSNIRDDEKAYFWYLKAAKSGNGEAQVIVGRYWVMHEQYEKALPWFKKAASQQEISAPDELAHWYIDNDNPQKDYQQALYWAKQALDTDPYDAQNLMGYIYYEGLGVPKDNKKALYWFQKASKAGNPIATSNLGEMYYRGSGVPQDYQKAIELYKAAVKENFFGAAVNLGYMYDHGLGTAKDPVQAVQWYTTVSHKPNNKEALYQVAESFITGKSSSQDAIQAWAWMSLAVYQKHPKAIKRLPALSQTLSPSQKEEANHLLQRIAPATAVSNTLK